MDSNGHILPVFNCSGDTKNLEYHNKNFSEWPAIGHLGKKKKKKSADRLDRFRAVCWKCVHKKELSAVNHIPQTELS